MQSRRAWLVVLAAAFAVPTVARAQESGGAARQEPAKAAERKAAPQPALPKIGDSAPTFELKGVDGKTYRLADYKDKIVVLEWMNQGCPYSNFETGVGPKAKTLSEKYKAKGVVWLAIDSTHTQTAENDAKFAAENKIPHPVLMDTDGKVGRMYGARTTPHMFVISKGKLAYSGAFGTDPRRKSTTDESRCYVDEALTALLDGKEVPLTTSEPWGCSVKYKPEK